MILQVIGDTLIQMVWVNNPCKSHCVLDANPDHLKIGLMEYFQWCEDMNMEPVLALWAGLALASGGNTPLTGDALSPFVDDALAELEVCHA
jgi:alpha-L-arabinofuranosidase